MKEDISIWEMKDEIIFWRTMTPREVSLRLYPFWDLPDSKYHLHKYKQNQRIISCHHGTLFLIYPLHLLQGRAIDILQRKAVWGVRRGAPGGAGLPTEDHSLLFRCCVQLSIWYLIKPPLSSTFYVIFLHLWLLTGFLLVVGVVV